MGRFGIPFSDVNGEGFKVDRKLYYATINNEGTGYREGPFQRCLAWISFIIMVLTAFFTFNSTSFAGVADHATLMEKDLNRPTVNFPASKINRDAVTWTLRATR